MLILGGSQSVYCQRCWDTYYRAKGLPTLAMGTPIAVATNAMGVAELQAIIGTTGPDMGRRGSTRCVTARGPPLPSSP